MLTSSLARNPDPWELMLLYLFICKWEFPSCYECVSRNNHPLYMNDHDHCNNREKYFLNWFENIRRINKRLSLLWTQVSRTWMGFGSRITIFLICSVCAGLNLNHLALLFWIYLCVNQSICFSFYTVLNYYVLVLDCVRVSCVFLEKIGGVNESQSTLSNFSTS